MVDDIGVGNQLVDDRLVGNRRLDQFVAAAVVVGSLPRCLDVVFLDAEVVVRDEVVNDCYVVTASSQLLCDITYLGVNAEVCQ